MIITLIQRNQTNQAIVGFGIALNFVRNSADSLMGTETSLTLPSTLGLAERKETEMIG